jgi:hypothetical protein
VAGGGVGSGVGDVDGVGGRRQWAGLITALALWKLGGACTVSARVRRTIVIEGVVRNEPRLRCIWYEDLEAARGAHATRVGLTVSHGRPDFIGREAGHA